MTLDSDGPQGLLDIIGACCEAGGDPSLWPAALRLIGHAVSSHAVLLVEIERPSGSRRLIGQYGLGEKAARFYADETIQSDPSLAGLAPAPRVEVFASAQDGDVTIRCQLASNGRADWLLLVRRPSARAGLDDVARFIGSLAPHLGRSLATGAELARLKGLEASIGAMLERLDIGVALVDRHGRIVQRNSRARELLGQDDAIGSAQEAPAGGFDTRDLDLLFGARAGKPAGEAWSALSARGERKIACRIRFEVLSEPSNAAPDAPVFMLLLSPETGSDAECTLDQLRHLYGLTPAESKLALALAAGKSLGEVAGEFNISKYTVRAQLRQIFAKTDTHRQAELVKLLLSPPQSAA